MEPVTTLLITALVAGAAAAATKVAGQAIEDAYDGLKDQVVARLGSKGKVENAIQEVEERPKSEGRQMVLKEELESAIATDPAALQEPELLKHAEKLLTLLHEKGHPTDVTVHIVQTGSGGLAYGAGVKAAGERGIVADKIEGSVATGDNVRQIRSDYYNETQVDTGGGAVVGGNVETGGGDFIGRDKNVRSEGN